MKTCKKCSSVDYDKWGACKPCAAMRRKKWAEENKEKMDALQKEWRDKNRPRISQLSKDRYSKNKESMLSSDRKRYALNKERYNANKKLTRTPEYNRLKASEWRARNKGKKAAEVAKRYHVQLKATPAWANMFYIKEAYILSQLRYELTGVKHHVDHIVPIKGSLVSGLHSHDNLQVIPAYENIIKNNNYNI